MKEKEFNSFFQDGQQLLRSEPGTFSHERIIKNKQVRKIARIKKFTPGEFEERVPEIYFIENDGQVSEIQFKCPCGCKASVELVTDSSPQPAVSEKTAYETALMDS